MYPGRSRLEEEGTLLTAGVDLGGTKVEMALVDEAGRAVHTHRRATRPEDGPERLIADVSDGVKALVHEAGQPAQALGVGVAGQIERATGSVSFAPNLGWTNVPFKAILQKALDVPVVVTNDVRAATWGEWRHGSGSGTDDMVCIFVGTGVGGGVVTGGRVIEGHGNAAGELGHITIVAGGRQCRCRNRGCLEAYVGGWAIAERAQEAAGADPQAGRELIHLAGGVDRVSAATVSEAYAAGDRLARDLVDETGRYLADGVVGIVNVFNPRLLVMGGGVVEGIPHLASRLEPAVRARALPAVLESLRIATAELGGKAGVVGAAALAREVYGKHRGEGEGGT